MSSTSKPKPDMPPSPKTPQAEPSRALQFAFLFALLGICAGFPIVQAIYEMAVLKETPHVVKFFTQMPSKEVLHRWDQQAKDRSVFANWLRPRVLQLRYDLLGEMAPKAVPGVEDWLFYNEDVNYLLRPPLSDPRFYKGTFDTLINGQHVNLRNPLVAMRDFRDRLKARGIELLVVPIPGKPSLYPEKLWKGFSDFPTSPTMALLDSLRSQGFHVADIYTPMREAKQAGSDLLYLKRDTHWTPAGLKIAAETIARRIHELVPAPSNSPTPTASADSTLQDSVHAQATVTLASPRYAVKKTPVERWGDVAEMTKVPKRREIWSVETVEAEQIVDSSGAPYRDDPASDILWLGDSYSRIYQTDAPKAAGVIAHVAHHLHRPLTSIVNDGGASTVVRQQLSRRGEWLAGKKLVVWTFVERDLRFGSKGWQIEALPD